mgnify:CR=1 FL=1
MLCVMFILQNIDKDKNGKVTMTELEEAGLALGFSLEQIQRLFSRWGVFSFDEFECCDHDRA